MIGVLMHFSPLAPLASPALKKAANGYIATMMWGLDQFRNALRNALLFFHQWGGGRGIFAHIERKKNKSNLLKYTAYSPFHVLSPTCNTFTHVHVFVFYLQKSI